MSPSETAPPVALRLIWPQWQGASPGNVIELFPDAPAEQAVRGYAVGTSVLRAVLPPHTGPTAVVPVSMGNDGLETRDGVDAKDAILAGLSTALKQIAEYQPDSIVTFGGECSVSVAPFAALAQRYPNDLAVVWIDSHPDVGTPLSDYHGYHAMAVAVLTGHGDPEIVAELPATIPGPRIALAGLHSWTDDDYPNAASWGIPTFTPDDLRDNSDALLEWLQSTGCRHVVIHLDVDVVDSKENIFGLGQEPDGLSSTQVRRLVSDITAAADVVGFTVAEYIPRQVIALQQLVSGFPLL